MVLSDGNLLGTLVSPIHAHVQRPPGSSNDSEPHRASNGATRKGRRRSRRRSSVETGGNFNPEEDLPILLQQSRSRLKIEESHELQAGTEMGFYMMRNSSKAHQTEAVASRAPVGFLRPNSFARRVAMTAFLTWAQARREAEERWRLASMRLSGNTDPERGGSRLGPSRRSSVESVTSGQISADTQASDSMIGTLSAAPRYLNGGGELPEKARLLHGSFAAALASAPRNSRGTLMKSVEKVLTGGRTGSKDVAEGELCSRQVSGSSCVTEDLSEEKVDKKPSNKKINRVSPDQSPRGGRARIDSYEDLHPARREERAKRERLMEDATYIENQMDKLRRGKVMLRESLAKTSAPDLFENSCLYTAYAQQILRRKENSSKDGDSSFSLPNLHQRNSPANSPMSESGRKKRAATTQNFYEKRKGADNVSTSPAAMQVRDLQALMSKSVGDLMNPSEEKPQKQGKNLSKSRSEKSFDGFSSMLKAK
eukprot:gb/GFBE01064875.1/.p1 GENE.gb/GFBE01064875.1/~~gb/GFBE01064875.1/.p1  ORF type:complete len:482 (+),score=77.12 gb/GFBE01064875.1/:1-1446(+)